MCLIVVRAVGGRRRGLLQPVVSITRIQPLILQHQVYFVQAGWERLVSLEDIARLSYVEPSVGETYPNVVANVSQTGNEWSLWTIGKACESLRLSCLTIAPDS